jgi:DNA-binding response OmpR family regulator
VKTAAQLQEELDEANETIRCLRETLAESRTAMRVPGVHLTRSERAILWSLKAGNTVTKEYLRKRIDAALERWDDVFGIESVTVHLVRLRRKLAQLTPPIVIENDFGVGFFLDKENRARLAQLLEDPE